MGLPFFRTKLAPFRLPSLRYRRLREYWPHWPLSLTLVAMGTITVLEGFQVPLTAIEQVSALKGLAQSLYAVGGTAQVIMGLLLIGGGIGLMRRLSFAWTLSFLLLVVAIALGVARREWGAGFALQVVVLAGLWFWKHHFTRRTALASLVFSLSNVAAILGYGTFGSYLMGSGFKPQIHDLETAFYFAVISLSTVGYGDIVPVTREARWFVVSLLVVGLSVFATTIVSAIGPKISHELNRLFNPREKAMKPKDHVILVGKGAIARNTAKEMERRHIAYVQIVSTKTEADANDLHIIEGDATDDAVLQSAGIADAKLVIAAREDDSENAFIVLAVKVLNPHVRVLAVASTALSLRRLKLARADVVFSPAAVGSRLLADLVEGTEILPEFRDLLET